MRSTRTRLNLVIDRDLHREIGALARRRATSVAVLTTELIRDALERQEDRALAKIATRRERASARTVPHHKAW